MGKKMGKVLNCKVPGCRCKTGGGHGGGRGMCKACHGEARAAIKSGNTTWEELTRLGLCLPVREKMFAKALEAARKIASGK